MPDGEPSALEHSLPLSNKSLFKPGDHLSCFRLGAATFDIIVRQRHVERILARNKTYGNKVPATGRIRIVIPAVARAPVLVPGTPIVRNRVVSGWAFTDPENCGHNIALPAIAPGPGKQRIASPHQ